MTKEVFWLRYQNLRNRLHAIKDEVAVAGFDLDAMARNLPENSYPETDLNTLISDIEELAEHAREVRNTAKAKHVNGKEANARIDQMIGAAS
jgi:hypothetical protein